MPAASPVKQTGRCSKLSGNFSMSMKYFSTPGTLPLYSGVTTCSPADCKTASANGWNGFGFSARSEEHTSELQSHVNLVCRLLLEKKKKKHYEHITHHS